MTVTYTAEVATCRGFGCFLKLLFRWRGSIYKLVWLDLVIFLWVYYVLNLTYRFALDEPQKRHFEAIVKYCGASTNLIPLSFVLGFYVTIVMTRWWNQYISIPWPDSIAVFVSSIIHGQDERGRVMRRTIMRYVCLCLVMVLRNIAPRVKKRFPTLEHFIEAGLLLENEKVIMDNLNEKFPPYSKHWLPIVWAASIVTRARREGRIRDDFGVKTVIDELNKFRGQCGILISYDTISIPLVYTQVVTLAVYSYFLTSVMGQQWVENKTVEDGYLNFIDLYFPVFTTLQFFFYMGWLKVAESLINPFGEDDDDFEVNWMVDRNIQVSYIIVDEMHHDHPELVKDQYWDDLMPDLPYTLAAQKIREEIPQPSTAKVEVSHAAAEMIPVVPSSVKMGNEEDFGIHFTTGSKRHGSSTSVPSMAGTITRVATVASALKKFFNREDSRTENTPRMSGSASSASLQNRGTSAHGGSIRIPDQIEEVDEQLTITSIRPETRPRADTLFHNATIEPSTHDIHLSKTPQSAPIDIPARLSSFPYMRTQSSTGHVSTTTDQVHTPNMIFPPGGVDALLGTSIPMEDIPQPPVGSLESTKSMESYGSRKSVKQRTQQEGGTDIKTDDHPPQRPLSASGQIPQSSLPTTSGGDDEFEKLRIAREQEKIERQKQKLTRSVSIHQQTMPPLSATPIPSQIPTTPVDATETEALIDQLLDAATESLTKLDTDLKQQPPEPDAKD